MPDSSRASVRRTPRRRETDGWSSPYRSSKWLRASSPARCSTRLTAVANDSFIRDDAWRRGATKAPARSTQWVDDSEGRPCVASMRVRVTMTARSHTAAARNGEYPTRRTPDGAGTVPEGSNNKVCSARSDAAIIRTTSSFVEVTTAALLVDNKFGMMSELVFPLRLGPMTNVDRSDPLVTSPCWPRPRYTPKSFTTHNGHE
jgi:hypothetical protein